MLNANSYCSNSNKKKLLYFLSIITFCALNKQILNLMNIFKAYYSNM